MIMKRFFLFCLMFCNLSVLGRANKIHQLKKLAGCYLVDYNYSETKSLLEGYSVDPRSYDIKDLIVKELIKVTESGSDYVRLQHFMQAETSTGRVVFKMRHHGETWHKGLHSYFSYQGPTDQGNIWYQNNLEKPTWVRKIWSLDDGLRYQCPGAWSEKSSYPSFTCSASSPIPGRETRDMGRKDYNMLDRTSQVQIFPNSFFERQDNIKVIFANDKKIPLAQELGKIWSTRLPLSHCEEVDSWAKERQIFWDILASKWSQILKMKNTLHEIKTVSGSTRSQKISKLLQSSYEDLNQDNFIKDKVAREIYEIITMHLK